MTCMHSRDPRAAATCMVSFSDVVAQACPTNPSAVTNPKVEAEVIVRQRKAKVYVAHWNVN